MHWGNAKCNAGKAWIWNYEDFSWDQRDTFFSKFKSTQNECKEDCNALRKCKRGLNLKLWGLFLWSKCHILLHIQIKTTEFQQHSSWKLRLRWQKVVGRSKQQGTLTQVARGGWGKQCLWVNGLVLIFIL